MTHPPFWRSAALAAAFAITAVFPAEARQFRCVARATGETRQDGSRQEDAQAGGTNSNVICGEEEPVCFDVSSPTGQARTRGGTDPSFGGTPGFPIIESSVSGELVKVGRGVEIITADTLARADATSGALLARLSATRLRISGREVILAGGPVDCDRPGRVTEVPGVVRLVTGKTTCTTENGIAEIVIDAAAIESPPGKQNEIVYGRSAAGVEIPVGGDGGCSATPAGASSAGQLLVAAGLLWLLFRRRGRA